MKGYRNNISLVRVTDASVEPVTLAEAKDQCEVYTSDDDTLITGLVKTARRQLENFCERSFINQTWKITLDDWPRTIYLPRGPVIAITSIQYRDSDEVVQSWASSEYYLDISAPLARIEEKVSYPIIDTDGFGAIVVTYTAGYGADGTAVPEDIKLAIKAQVSHLYQNRGDSAAMGLSALARDIIQDYKVYDSAFYF